MVVNSRPAARSSDAKNGSALNEKKKKKGGADGSPANHVNPTWGRFNGDSWYSVVGCGAIMVLCPILAILFSVALADFNGSITTTLLVYATSNPIDVVVRHFPRPTMEAMLGYAAWLLFQGALYMWLPGQIGYGQRTPAGYLLPYRVNGFQAWIVTHALAAGAVALGYLDGALIAKHWDGLMIAMNVYGFFLAGISYLKALVDPTHPEDRKFSGTCDFLSGCVSAELVIYILCDFRIKGL